jgi:hypothetical protein
MAYTEDVVARMVTAVVVVAMVAVGAVVEATVKTNSVVAMGTEVVGKVAETVAERVAGTVVVVRMEEAVAAVLGTGGP